MFSWSRVMARFAVCCILLGLYVTYSTRAVCNSNEESSRQCGELLYEVYKYTCCDGNITQGANLSCCGKTAYNRLESSCCQNTITDGLSQSVSYCCGPQAYNPLNQICCNGHVQNKTSAHTSCCGSALYDQKKQLCCNKMLIHEKETENHACCGSNKTFNKLKQCCDDSLEVQNISSLLCTHPNQGNTRTSTPNISTPRPEDKTKNGLQGSARSETLCGLTSFNPLEKVCCSGNLFSKRNGVTQCCGTESYDLTEEGVLCCEEQLYRNQPAGSMCTGNVPYSPQNFTACQKHVHLPAGQQCCGKKTFDPHVEICCNGHRHKGTVDMACCGSHAYNASAGNHICCSGHLHDLTPRMKEEEAGCCGPVLLTNKKEQQCCHSGEKTLVYKVQPDHFCCGHWYYNMSLWSCCAGQLIPKPTKGSQADLKFIRPLFDYSKSVICNESVLLGTVESVAVKQNKRFVVLKEVLEFNVTVTSCGNALEIGPLDHCLFPALELGRTYLWMRASTKYEPLADVTGLTSPIHTILSLCQANRKSYAA